ncbi:3-dehydroquinate synthase [Fimbriimonas ginsengisoli]|uniref:3-dehydroquinate synthase n=1 Tax=Fimbriimonas ginsengisoli Gsoil 348 TaxID=661478 RepID=A0A068NQX4_FIMGI|nr:3-dehydroquinate synthase [Fimbriimonas ginsengisoli]AIE85782.1 3-dehydroquinate synthase [Fimbriimonas ginsengisoli Gsoil 348]
MTIRHSFGSYEIVDTPLEALLNALPPSSFVITDQNVQAALSLPDLPTLVLEPGEGNKSLAVYGRCLEWLAGAGASRRSTVVALGGGVVGDLAGFVAATYMRGVPFVQIPTTLLAQVDSSVGGKVGLDLQAGKNLVGDFYPPTEVRLCAEVLATLPERQFNAGMAEVWKYGAIMDADLYARLRRSRLHAGHPYLSAVVKRCIDLKAHIVEHDEFETTGLRAILNFGHTVAHAIESLTGYGPVLHGEAVAIGMVAEARLGTELGITPAGVEENLRESLTEAGLPTVHPLLNDTEAMLRAMRRDKKAVEGRLAFSLLTQIGRCKLVEGVPETKVRDALTER